MLKVDISTGTDNILYNLYMQEKDQEQEHNNKNLKKSENTIQKEC